MKTFTWRNRSGTKTIEVPYSRTVTLYGVPGFAVHRPVINVRGTGLVIIRDWWEVSHIESGINTGAEGKTQEKAVQDAKVLIRIAAAARHISEHDAIMMALHELIQDDSLIPQNISPDV